MTPIMLQRFLVEDLGELFDGFKLKNPVNGELVAITVYPQYLPAPTAGIENPVKFPHLRVIVLEGEDPNAVDPHKCGIFVQVSVWDDSPDYQGFVDAVNLVTRIYQHWMNVKVFDNQFEVDYPVRWKIHEDNNYPYFFAGITADWIVGKALRKETDFDL